MTGHPVIDQSGTPVAIEILAVRYGIAEITDWEHESVEDAIRGAESMADHNVAAPVAVIVGDEIRLTHFAPDFEWRTPTDAERSQVARLLAAARRVA